MIARKKEERRLRIGISRASLCRNGYTESGGAVNKGRKGNARLVGAITSDRQRWSASPSAAFGAQSTR
jgi:hypothetical protein